MQTTYITCVLALTLTLPAAAGVQAWYEPSARKIMRDARANLHAGSWQLAAARGEVEACQLVLKSDVRVAEVRVEASALRGPSGALIEPELRLVHYIPSADKSTSFPDPLPPIRPFELVQRQAQPVWVSVRIPAHAAPGVHEGFITYTAGRDSGKLPLSVKVWDFALPETPSCVTAFGLSPHLIAPQHGVDPSSVKAKQLHMKYYEMLLDHRISAYHIPVDLGSKQAEKYLADPRMTSYMIPYLPDDDALGKLTRKLGELGLLDKGYFYPVDEPNSPAGYEQLNAVVQRLRRIEPRFRIVSPFFCNPDYDPKLKAYDLMVGKVNIWCPESCLWDNVNIWAPAKGPDPTLGPLMDERRKAGDSVWWYVCCGPGSPYCNFFLDMDAMQHRMLFWQQKTKGIQGLLYWETTYWNPAHGCPDPWETMTTLTHVNPTLMGDGSLLYPGKKVGIDGPVPSQRLEVIRDGIEDFDYLTIAGALLGEQESQEFASRLVRSLTDYERDPLKLESVRRELGDEIERAVRGTKRRLPN